ncbi:hypothetical protein H0W91_00475 [Patescibacteria group bacterium]|nr:hypothetical protein [Patescibacteria group bacterium]
MRFSNNIKNKFLFLPILILFCCLLVLPVVIYATDAPLVNPSSNPVNEPVRKNTNTGITYECIQGSGDTAVYGNCGLKDLVAATVDIVAWGSKFALMFCVVILAWAGFKYMINGSNPSERTKINAMLVKVLIGMGFILAAWLIVTLITNSLLDKPVIFFK